MSSTSAINPKSFLSELGASGSSAETSLAMLSKMDLAYTELSIAERDAHILAILKRLDEPRISRTREQNLAIFEQGWSENLEQCRNQGISFESLKPKYVKPLPAMRLQGRFVHPSNPYLFDDLCTVVLGWLFKQYFKDADTVCEFGCGTGRYLYLLGTMMPGRNLIGLDWTHSSGEILKLISQKTEVKMQGHQFDMLAPSAELKLPQNAAVLTVGAMEQIGDRFGPFLSFLLESRPSIVVHHEPIVELYGQDTLFDYLAVTYHRRRKYLEGYLPALRELAKQNKIELIKEQRGGYGDPFNEGSSIIVWRPI